jgi:hypothetical protein
MSDSAPVPLDLAAVRTIVATRGIDLAPHEAAAAVDGVRHARAVLASLVAELLADDDIHGFRATLESELPR